MKTILITVSGISPAILTETVWALANEKPSIVPDEVVVITTSRGEADLQKALLETQSDWDGKNVWETLRANVCTKAGIPVRSKKLQLSIRVIELPDETTGVRTKAADLRNRDDNDAAADFIVQTLAPFADAEDNHVIASIAGGRKTMGALLYAAMSLLGKESDRVTHVLVSEPFETCRGFFYPGQPAQELEARPYGQPPLTIRAADAIIDLADLAFVPLRNGFLEMNEGRRTFSGLVSRYSRDLRRMPGGLPRVGLDLAKGQLSVENKRIPLTGRTLLLSAFLLERARHGLPHFENAVAAESEFCGYFLKQKTSLWNHAKLRRYFEAKSVTADDIVKALSDLRTRLEKAGAAVCIPSLAPERARVGFEIAPGESTA